MMYEIGSVTFVRKVFVKGPTWKAMLIHTRALNPLNVNYVKRSAFSISLKYYLIQLVGKLPNFGSLANYDEGCGGRELFGGRGLILIGNKFVLCCEASIGW